MRYRTLHRPFAAYIGYDPYANGAASMTADTVIETDGVFTGLLDANGNEIHRVQDQVGFVRFGEKA